MEVVGKVILARRVEFGMTQGAAASRAGVSVDTWRRAERESRCGDLSLAGIANALKVAPEELRPRPEIRGIRPVNRDHLMCRRCAQPVSRNGIRVTLNDSTSNLLRLRTRRAEGETFWPVAKQAAYYCSLECLVTMTTASLRHFTRELQDRSGADGGDHAQSG